MKNTDILSISSADISVVVQGAVDPEITSVCLKKIRNVLPQAQIILSTWENTDVHGLDADEIIFSSDPGAFFVSLKTYTLGLEMLKKTGVRIYDNINRQLVSTNAGMRHVKRKYTLKLRTDLYLENADFINYFGRYDLPDEKEKLFKNRVLICNYYTRNPRVRDLAFHPSDWFAFGNSCDVKDYYDVPLQTQEDAEWFLGKAKRSKLLPQLTTRYLPEQHICVNFIKKHMGLKFDCYYENNADIIQNTECFLARNMVVLDYEKMIGISFPKFGPEKSLHRFGPVYDHYNHAEWLALYEKYCLKKYSPKYHRMKKMVKISKSHQEGDWKTVAGKNIPMEDISVVVQGAIDMQNTPPCLKSIREALPGATIILSTWEGSDVSGLDYDKVILNKDPGAFSMALREQSNVKRQIHSTVQGLKAVKTTYALKLRSDLELESSNFLKYWDKFPSYDKDWHFLKGRIIIPSLVTRDPRHWESPMCPSDWASFGYTVDMLTLWDVPYPSKDEESWFAHRERPALVNYYYSALVSRYNPEQTVWVGFVRKFVKQIYTDHMFDINKLSIQQTLSSYANNLIILSMKQYGLKARKAARKTSDRWHIVTYKDFIKIYNTYANGKKASPLIDTQRLGYLKGFMKSNKRLYSLAKRNDAVKSYVSKEIAFIAPTLHRFLQGCYRFYKKISNLYIDNREKPLTMKWGKHDAKPFFTIAMPVHGRLGYLQDALDSLKRQTCKDFELIIADDSSLAAERKDIRNRLAHLHTVAKIPITYIYTQRNLGQSANTNQALSYIKGSWVRIFHSDDILHNKTLEFEKKYLLSNKDKQIAAIYHRNFRFEETCETQNLNTPDRCFVETPTYVFTEGLAWGCAIPSALLFSAQSLEYTGQFNTSFRRACDWDFFSRIIQYAFENKKALIRVNQKYVYWRDVKNSNHHRLKTKFANFSEYQKLARANLEFMEKHGFNMGQLNKYNRDATKYRYMRVLRDYKDLTFYEKTLCFRTVMKILLRDINPSEEKF